MMNILVSQPTEKDLDDLEVRSWGIWGCEASTFDWEYDETEICYILEGEVTVKTDDGLTEIKAGDLVTFPKGLKCVWDVTSPIRKHYRFE